MEEKIYQTITIKGSNEKYLVDAMEYPFQQLNILYIKFIVYNKLGGDNNSIIMKPISFLTVQPQDVLIRSHIWSQDHEDELINASNIATQQRKDYQEALEEEMVKKAEKIKNHEEYNSSIANNEDDDIDPDFSTPLNPNDNMWM